MAGTVPVALSSTVPAAALTLVVSKNTLSGMFTYIPMMMASTADSGQGLELSGPGLPRSRVSSHDMGCTARIEDSVCLGLHIYVMGAQMVRG